MGMYIRRIFICRTPTVCETMPSSLNFTSTLNHTYNTNEKTEVRDLDAGDGFTVCTAYLPCPHHFHVLDRTFDSQQQMRTGLSSMMKGYASPFHTPLSSNPFFFNLFAHPLSLTPTLPDVLCLLQLFTQLELQVSRNRLEAKPIGFPGRTRTRRVEP